MSQYRRISMPKCPYCQKEVQYTIDDSATKKLVGLATGTRGSGVINKCKRCGESYRVTCSIRFYGRK